MFVKETEWLKVEHHRLQSRGEEGDNEKALLSKVLYMYTCTLLLLYVVNMCLCALLLWYYKMKWSHFS